MPKYSAWLCINRAPWLLTLNEACQLLPYCGTLLLTLWTPPKKSYSLSALIGESTHHALILNGRMVGSPDPPFFQDLAACEEKGYRCGKGGRMRSVTCLVVSISCFPQCQPRSGNQPRILLLWGSSIRPTDQNPGRLGLGEEISGFVKRDKKRAEDNPVVYICVRRELKSFTN